MASECVKVMVRCRPMNSKEKNRGCQSICDIDKPTNQVIVRPNEEGGPEEKIFAYDSVYGVDSTQRQVYDETAFPLVESVIGGYNGTIFAYGQTGCGKTHTMVGLTEKEHQGIIPNAFEHIYGCIDDQANVEKKFLVRCSYVEIYNEEIRDLLGDEPDKKLDLKENPQKGVFVKDLTIMTVKSIREIESMMNQGNSLRKVGQTAMNDTSSRSHSLFTIYIETAETVKNKQRFKAGKLNLVDLAGSERQSKTQATGIRLKEATKINLSLSALGNVISALVDGRQSHIPYRDSKLTRLLQDSLGGNTKTVMIAAISPADYNLDETLSTLRYASRAKSIKNKPRVNEDPKDALLKQYEDEIKRLKAMLETGGPAAAAALAGAGAAGAGGAAGPAGGSSAAGAGQASNVAGVEAALNLQRQGSQESVNLARRGTTKEETVEALLQKLQKKGKNVKIVAQDEDEAEKEQRAKQDEEMRQLQELMSNMEAQLVKGGEALEEAEKEKAQNQRKLQLQLEEERIRQEALLAEKVKAEENILQKEQQYNSLQEEVESQRKIIKTLKQKYRQAESELNAQTKDQVDVRLELTETIREQEKDLDFYMAICNMMLKDGEMYRLKEKIEYDFESGKWKVPPFLVKNKEVAFPRIKNAMNLVRDELDQREVVLAETGEVLSAHGNSSAGSAGRYDRSGIQPTFKNGQVQQQASRQRKRVDKLGSGVFGDGTGDSQGFKGSPPFRKGYGAGKNSMEDAGRFNADYYVSGRGTNDHGSSSSSRDIGDVKYGGGKFDNHASQMSMKRNDSDFAAPQQRTVPQKKSHKYNSLDRGDPMDENEVSPLMMKKKANVHLQPMSHKKAHLMQTGLGNSSMKPPADTNMNHSESNPILGQPVINDRVKLEKLNHIPSVKSNLMQSDTMSQGNLETVVPGINYQNMPIGKKSVLAPINVLNTQLDGSGSNHPVLSKIENNSQMLNRKNNRTLKPLQR